MGKILERHRHVGKTLERHRHVGRILERHRHVGKSLETDRWGKTWRETRGTSVRQANKAERRASTCRGFYARNPRFFCIESEAFCMS